MDTAMEGNLKIKDLLDLIEAMCSPNEFIKIFSHQTNYGKNALMWSVLKGQFEMVQFLLETAERIFGGKETRKFKYFLETCDSDDNTALNLAWLKDNKPIAELLMQYGARFYRKRLDGFPNYDYPPKEKAAMFGLDLTGKPLELGPREEPKRGRSPERSKAYRSRSRSRENRAHCQLKSPDFLLHLERLTPFARGHAVVVAKGENLRQNYCFGARPPLKNL